MNDEGNMSIFHPLNVDAAKLNKHQKFNNPFYYTPDELTLEAARQLQEHLPLHPTEGKMCGVLVVEYHGAIGFLTAYSGQISDDMAREVGQSWIGCPPIVDYLQPDGYFKTREREISDINRRIKEKETSHDFISTKSELQNLKAEAEKEIARRKAVMKDAKAKRDKLRESDSASDEASLIRESQFLKAEVHRAKVRYRKLVDEAEAKVKSTDDEIEGLKRKRKLLSDHLQSWLFNQFVLLNARGESRAMPDIFHDYYRSVGSKMQNASTPCPSGAGECCEPKLLQYAFAHGMHPISMVAFWWGPSPKNELRRHGNFYPACSGRCKPILDWMLRGLDVETNPLHSEVHQPLSVVYEDEYIAVVNKPAGMLSVPGKSQRESVVSLLAKRWGDGARPHTVHRLDMATSGLMVVAKNEHCQRNLQRQFEARTVKKEYIAVVKASNDDFKIGNKSNDVGCSKEIPVSGRISLPLRADTNDRPRQVVDYENGKPAVTLYRVLSRVSESDGQVVTLALRPLTGRTHQLRVHCASQDGLDAPIIGDSLYGSPAERLYLHAAFLEFIHPITGKRLHFRQDIIK